jgi:hypothetical protein
MKDQEGSIYRAIARGGHHIVRFLWNASILRNGAKSALLMRDCDRGKVNRCIDELAAVVFLKFNVVYGQRTSS